MGINKGISYINTQYIWGKRQISKYLYSSEFLRFSIRNIHYLILRETELELRRKLTAWGGSVGKVEELRRNKQNRPDLSFFSCQQTCRAY